MKHIFNKSIIREYDIRGVYSQTLKDIDAEVLGYIFSKSFTKNKIVNVCYDGRKSSIPLKNSLVEGLISGGAKVFEIGLGPTPMLYYSCFLNNAEAGIMVTGSHNPPTHNGFKIVKNNLPFFGDQLKELTEGSHELKANTKNLKSKNFAVKDLYVNKLISSLCQKKNLNIAWDAGNGAAGEVMSLISKHIEGDQFLMFEDIDGNFPNHHPDPSESKNMQSIMSSVKEKKLDFGIAFDGDGDRIGVVDNKGRMIPGDLLLLLYAKEILKKNKHAVIIGDVKCSQVLFDQINFMGGKSIMSKTGHSLIKNCMKKEKAHLAGEMSGHMFFSDKYYGFDDALYASIRLVNLVSNSEKNISSLVDEFPTLFNTPEIRINCDDEKKFEVIEKIIRNQKTKNFIEIDGIRVQLKNGWWLLRASNTQPCIVLRCEANSDDELNVIIKNVKYELDKVDKSLSKQIMT